jgi:hypothetical protein
MNNEEMEREIGLLYTYGSTRLVEGKAIPPSVHPTLEQVRRFARALVLRAYEEAAQKAEEYSRLEPWYDTQATEIGEAATIADAIRDLKDSLAVEPVAS